MPDPVEARNLGGWGAHTEEGGVRRVADVKPAEKEDSMDWRPHGQGSREIV